MTSKCLDVVHLKSQMRQVRTYLHRTTRIIFANLDQLVACGRFEKDQLGAPSTGLASHLFEPEHARKSEPSYPSPSRGNVCEAVFLP